MEVQKKRREIKNAAATAATALNAGSPWSDVEATFDSDPRAPKIKEALAAGLGSDGPVKKGYSEFTDPVPAKFVVSHDNGTTVGVWRADVDTSTEPTKDSSEWTLLFEV